MFLVFQIIVVVLVSATEKQTNKQNKTVGIKGWLQVLLFYIHRQSIPEKQS
jgi:hypothetical protein